MFEEDHRQWCAQRRGKGAFPLLCSPIVENHTLKHPLNVGQGALL